MKKFFGLFVFIATVLPLSAQNHIVDEVVWVVGDEAILRSDVERVRTDFGSNIKGNPYCVIPEQLAVQKLFLHQAELDSITVGDNEVNKAVEMKREAKLKEIDSKEYIRELNRKAISKRKEE